MQSRFKRWASGVTRAVTASDARAAMRARLTLLLMVGYWVALFGAGILLI